VFELSLIFMVGRAHSGRREETPRPSLSLATRQLNRPCGDHRRQDREWPTDRDPRLALSVFFPFDPRRLVAGGLDCRRP
jgi:hypothetical protein